MITSVPDHVVAMARQIASDADQVRHVHVVPAGVHHADGRAALVLRADLRGVRQAGLFGDGQRVEIGPQHERLARAVLQHADDAVAADACRHREPRRLELRGKPGGRFLFLEARARAFGGSVDTTR